MVSSRSSPAQDKFGRWWQFAVGVALVAGGLYFVHLVNGWTISMGSGRLRELFVLLNQYHGKWIIAALMAALGVAFCIAAIRQMQAAPSIPSFPEGITLLESARWMNASERDKTV